MTCSSYRHIRAEHGIVPHINVGIIYQRQVEIGIDAMTEMHMPATEVCMQRRLDIAVLPNFREHFFQHFFSFFLLRGARHIKII